MRGYGSYDEGWHRGRQQGSAGCQGVSSGAGGRGDDDAVAAQVRYYRAVDVNLDIRHAPAVTADYYVVQGELLLAFELCGQQAALVFEVVTLENAADLLLELVGVEVGQKAQAAAIDSEQTRLAIEGDARGFEEITVAADYYQKVAAAY